MDILLKRGPVAVILAGHRRINLGVSPEEWKNWFDRTALDEIDRATLRFFLLKARKKIRLRSREFQLPLIYLISGESFNTVVVVSTILAFSFIASFFYEWSIGQLCPASLAMFLVLGITSAFFWRLQYREVKSKYLAMLEKAERSIYFRSLGGDVSQSRSGDISLVILLQILNSSLATPA